MSLIPRTTDDFFAPIFGGWPFEAGALIPRAEGAGVGMRGMPVDVKEVSAVQGALDGAIHRDWTPWTQAAQRFWRL